jgi:hypothetical protein
MSASEPWTRKRIDRARAADPALTGLSDVMVIRAVELTADLSLEVLLSELHERMARIGLSLHITSEPRQP